MTTENDISTRIAVEGLGVATQLPPPRTKRKYAQTPKGKEAKAKSPHLVPHQWKKGQSGNPKGRPINPLSLTALLNKKLSENPDDAEAIVNALIALGKAKNMRAIEMSFERIDGKPVEIHRIEGELPVLIQFVPAQALFAPGPTSSMKIETVPAQALPTPVLELGDGSE